MDGVCPFAEQIAGGLDKAPNAGSFYDMVGVCDHAAGGFYGTLMTPSFWQQRGVSVNFAIARDGRIGQILNLFTAPYGQGADQNGNSITPSSPGISWPHWAEMGKRNPNVLFPAVEHEDWVSVNGVSRAVMGSEWTLEQYNADLKLKRWMVEEVQRVQSRNLLRFGIDSLADHHMFDPVNRANCAGQFWRNNYRAQLYNDLTQEDDMLQTERYEGELNSARALKALTHNLMLTMPIGFDPQDPHTLVFTDLQTKAEVGRVQLPVLPDYDQPS